MALRAELEARDASVRQALDAAQLLPPFRLGVALSALGKQRNQLLGYAPAKPLGAICLLYDIIDDTSGVIQKIIQ